MNNGLLVNARLISSLAAKLVFDLERNTLWEGDVTNALNQIQSALDAAREEGT